MRKEERSLVGTTGNSLFVRDWRPVNRQVRAVVCLSHGLGEHGGRYVHVAELMAEAGIAVIAFDHHGHGLSSGKRGHISSMEAATKDTALVIEDAGTKYENLPIFLYGHSMGGNIALNCALRLKPDIQGLILSSPWLRLAFKPPAIKDFAAELLASAVPSLQQQNGLDLADLFRPGYDKAFPFEEPLCHSKITVKTYLEVKKSGEWALQHASELQAPLYIFHGTSDRVTSHEASKLLLEKVGPRGTWRSWEGGYHELHNDLSGDRVIAEAIEWMNRQLE